MSPQAPPLVAGCDVVDVARLGAVIERRPGFLARVFTDRERADARRGDTPAGSPTERARLAARFAAKEATRKALGEMRLPFHAVEVRTGPDGAPRLWLRGRPAPLSCSLSHDGGVAMAVIVGLADLAGPVAPPAAAEPDTAPTPGADVPARTAGPNPRGG